MYGETQPKLDSVWFLLERWYFKYAILPLRSFVLKYPFLWFQQSKSSKGLCNFLLNLVLTYERVFWNKDSSCNQALRSQLLA